MEDISFFLCFFQPLIRMNILLPIETINRELDFKIILAALLAKKKYKIFIGQHDFLMSLLPSLQGGIYIGKNIFTKRSDIEKGEKYKLLKKNNFDIIYIHEEGAVFPGREEDWKRIIEQQYSLDYFDKNDIILQWGDFQNSFDKNRSKNLTTITTGHPRFDLYKPKWSGFFKPESDEIKPEFKEFILINGNYLANHGLGESYLFSNQGGYIVEDVQNRMRRVNYYAYNSKQFVSMVELTHELAIKFPELNFVYRPHPSENHDYYKIVFNGVLNIFVKHEGPVAPWILASKAVIHDGCTTALEATLASKPVINFKVELNEEFDIWLPNQMGIRAVNLEQVVAYINDIKENKIHNEPNLASEAVKELMYNFKADSFELFVNVVEEKLEQIKTVKSTSPSSIQIVLKNLKKNIKVVLYSVLSPSNRKEANYHKIKFYGFNKELVLTKFKRAEKLTNKKLKIIFHNSHLIQIENE